MEPAMVVSSAVECVLTDGIDVPGCEGSQLHLQFKNQDLTLEADFLSSTF